MVCALTRYICHLKERTMKRATAFFIFLFALSLSTVSANAAGPETVSFQSGNETAKGLLYTPAGSGKHPAVVVIHEWWGLNDWVKEQAADLAAHGYVALAVDMYRGQVASDPEMAHELMRGLPQDRGVRDLTSAVTYLQTRPDVEPGKIGAIGWCMGGGYALQLAIHDPSLKAVSINYGALATDPADLEKIHAAVVGNFGGQDHGIPAASIDAFAAQLKKQGVPVSVKIYPDAGHAFENPNNKTGYRAVDAADAQQRSRELFARVLGGKP
jgi:carboxymethylenebutenolidase